MIKEDKMDFLITNFTDLLSGYDGSSFTYGYDHISKMHILAIDPSSVYKDVKFGESCDKILDTFESQFNETILCLSKDDHSLKVLMKSPELTYLLNNPISKSAMIPHGLSTKEITYTECTESTSMKKNAPSIIHKENSIYNKPYRTSSGNNYPLAA